MTVNKTKFHNKQMFHLKLTLWNKWDNIFCHLCKQNERQKTLLQGRGEACTIVTSDDGICHSTPFDFSNTVLSFVKRACPNMTRRCTVAWTRKYARNILATFTFLVQGIATNLGHCICEISLSFSLSLSGFCTFVSFFFPSFHLSLRINFILMFFRHLCASELFGVSEAWRPGGVSRPCRYSLGLKQPQNDIKVGM